MHYTVLLVGFTQIPRHFPGQFSVSEVFIFAAINSFFLCFAFDGLINEEVKRYRAGCNISNILAFTPWMFLNFAGLVCLCSNLCCRRFPKFVFLISCTFGVALTYAYITPFNTADIWIQFINDVIIDNMALFGYMALTLMMGLLVLNGISDSVPNFILRKSFHLLAFVLFLPPICFSKYDKPRLICFAFNCVTVALILLEILRFGGHLPQSFSDWFKEKSSGRER